MAIRRCPYCKAIIDEGLEYCSNCGTQLIFPEDEFVDEEIPGEKIVDVTEEDAEPEKDESVEEERDLTAAADETDTEKKDEITEGEIETDASDLTEEEELKVETSEVMDEEVDIIPDTEETFVETGETEEESEVELKSEEIEEKIEEREDIGEDDLQDQVEELKEELEEEEPQKEEEFPPEQPSDYLEKPVAEAIPDTEEINQVEDVFSGVEEETGEISTDNESIGFKTEDLENIVDPAEKEKEEIEQFLNSLKEEREKTKKYYEETGELPPWAQSMKNGSLSSISSDENIESDEEIQEAEETILPEEDKIMEEEPSLVEEVAVPVEDSAAPADTGMGLPEKIDQKGLPFSQEFHEEESEEEGGPHFRFRDMNFPLWIKSRVFDVVMIAGLWLVTVWLASILVKASFFQLITVSTIPILIFLVILLTVYFFLFFFFLGETLGDQMFSQEE